jgi:hypothetical protein
VSVQVWVCRCITTRECDARAVSEQQANFGIGTHFWVRTGVSPSKIACRELDRSKDTRYFLRSLMAWWLRGFRA